jgi:hypothetical protein
LQVILRKQRGITLNRCCEVEPLLDETRGGTVAEESSAENDSKRAGDASCEFAARPFASTSILFKTQGFSITEDWS